MLPTTLVVQIKQSVRCRSTVCVSVFGKLCLWTNDFWHGGLDSALVKLEVHARSQLMGSGEKMPQPRFLVWEVEWNRPSLHSSFFSTSVLECANSPITKLLWTDVCKPIEPYRRKSGWNSGGRRADPEGLVGARGWEGARPPKMNFSHEMAWWFLVWEVKYSSLKCSPRTTKLLRTDVRKPIDPHTAQGCDARSESDDERRAPADSLLHCIHKTTITTITSVLDVGCCKQKYHRLGGECLLRW